MRHGKRFKAATARIDGAKRYTVEEAVDLVKANATSKFNETIEVATRLGIDPKQADQQVRGTVVLPHGTGKTVRVLVLTKGEKETEARDAGADHVGSAEFIKKLTDGWLDVDTIIATPDMMGEVGKLGKILGPRGLMPNPKSGTVTFDVAKAVRETKAGKIEYRTDKAGNVQAPVGKASFAKEALVENVKTFLHELNRAKPHTAKGNYMRSVTVSSTMGPGVKIDVQTEFAAH
jgi:large subunit ribosomal protein L1